MCVFQGNNACGDTIFSVVSLHLGVVVSSSMRTFDSYLIRAWHSQSNWQLICENQSVKISLSVFPFRGQHQKGSGFCMQLGVATSFGGHDDKLP